LQVEIPPRELTAITDFLESLVAGGRMRLISFIGPLALLCALSPFFEIKRAGAQCAAQDVAGNRHLQDNVAFSQSFAAVQSAATTPVWKTIKVGTVTSKWDLLRSLGAANCGVGDSAQEIFAQSDFVVSATQNDVDLVSLSVARLGLQAATLRDIYSRAQDLGFALPAAEIGPQLRLQYFEQPLGEFLNIGMTPIGTHNGGFEIFAVGNGGAGLLLVGKNAAGAMEFSSSARFVFVREGNVVSSQPDSN
jgi:hypothetical protein